MKYVIINRGKIVGKFESAIDADIAADEMRRSSIIAKIREWGEDPFSVSEKRWMEATWDIGRDGDQFQVVPIDECRDFLEEY